MAKLAVIILTKNEEANIAEAIKSASFADEIIIIDSGSTDKTVEIAQEHGGKIVIHPMDETGFAGQRNFALTQTGADWVFYLDADERITPEAAKRIKNIVATAKKAVYRVERKNIVFGKLMKYGGHRADYVSRLMPGTGVEWHGLVHEGVRADLPIKEIKNCLLHYTYITWEQYFNKFNKYTTLAAKEMAARGKRVSNTSIISHTIGAFVKNYFLKQGFRDGFLGLVMSFMATAYVMTKYMKLKNIYRLQGEQEDKWQKK